MIFLNVEDGPWGSAHGFCLIAITSHPVGDHAAVEEEVGSGFSGNIPPLDVYNVFINIITALLPQ